MKKITYLLVCLSLNIGWVVAQIQEVTGIVISSEDGEPVAGATVIEKGITRGTVTDQEGRFSLTITNPSGTLIVSYTGMTTREIAVQSSLFILLSPDIQILNEVVITAFGFRKHERTLGYATTTIQAEELTMAKPASVLEGLTGKVAGMNISGTAWAGASRTVQIWGISSFNKNQPLYIVDGIPITNQEAGYMEVDFGSTVNDMNPEDIESVTILKGASATALYGSRAANGVVMIQTKNAGKEKLSITYAGAFMASSVLRVMQTQDLFGQGWGSWSRSANGSWGPRLDGTLREWGSNQLNESMVKPFSYVKNNLRDFYQTGLETNNGLMLRYGDEHIGIITSYSHLRNNGILPENADLYKKHTFSLRGYIRTGKLQVESSVNYIHKDIQRIGGIELELLQHGVDISFAQMKDYTDTRYNLDNYYSYSTSNPYWLISTPQTNYKENHRFGKVELGYDLIPGLKLTGRIGADFLDYETIIRYPAYHFTEDSYSIQGGKIGGSGYYNESYYKNQQLDGTVLMSADYQTGNFSLGGLIGWNLNKQTASSGYSDINKLDVEGWYSLANSSSGVNTASEKWSRRLIGAFAQGEIGYKNWLFLTLSGRNDWSSTLPIQNNSFFYGGIHTSLILTELFPQLKNSGINFFKIRGAIGQTGNDADVYLTQNYYTTITRDSSDYYYTWLPINGVTGLTVSNILANPDLKPEMTTEYEVGITGSFLNNRIRVDVAYYNRQTKDQIITADLPPETGYMSQSKNIGHIENKGIELSTDFTFVHTYNWKWDVGITFARNRSLVKKLWEDVQEYTIFGQLGVQYVAAVGYPIGVFTIPAAEKVTDENSPYYGYTVVNNNGFIIESDTEKEVLGYSQPDFTMGIRSSLKYKNVQFTLLGDWRKGGYMYSGTAFISLYNGNSTHTLFNERNSYIVPNSVKIVNGEYVENNLMIKTNQINYALGNPSFNPEVRRGYIIPKDYFKIREISLSYLIPETYLQCIPVTSASVSLVG
ncbi:MAG: SusC/RagA family TonB-linked outer membrane protein [Tannerellaceae bacterium]|nr:SusC/RagA family TonB-linked outer membrane protein [Tannerellaceae bacterium]